jgi:hypothetical protein
MTVSKFSLIVQIYQQEVQHMWKHNARLSLVIFLFLGACAWGGAQRYIGQPLEPEERRPLDTAGEHVTRTNTFILHEEYRVDRAANQIQLAGRLNYEFPDSHWLGAISNRLRVETIYVQVLFADQAGEVIAIESFRLYPREPIFAPVSFEQTLRLPPESAFSALRLTSYFLDGKNQIVSRQISATKTEETGGVGGGSFGFRRGPAAELS